MPSHNGLKLSRELNPLNHAHSVLWVEAVIRCYLPRHHSEQQRLHCQSGIPLGAGAWGCRLLEARATKRRRHLLIEPLPQQVPAKRSRDRPAEGCQSYGGLKKTISNTYHVLTSTPLRKLHTRGCCRHEKLVGDVNRQYFTGVHTTKQDNRDTHS